jgi:hypothetical protein
VSNCALKNSTTKLFHNIMHSNNRKQCVWATIWFNSEQTGWLTECSSNDTASVALVRTVSVCLKVGGLIFFRAVLGDWVQSGVAVLHWLYV